VGAPIPFFVFSRYTPIPCSLFPLVTAPYYPRTPIGHHVFETSTRTIVEKIFIKHEIPEEIRELIRKEINKKNS
jgi:hypothetical protein